jgi:hypothetical protein
VDLPGHDPPHDPPHASPPRSLLNAFSDSF